MDPWRFPELEFFVLTVPELTFSVRKLLNDLLNLR